MVPSPKLQSTRSSTIKDRLDALGLVEDEEYNLRDIPQVRKNRGEVITKVYMLTPDAFKKCLMRSQRRAKQSVESKKCKIFLFWKIFKEKGVCNKMAISYAAIRNHQAKVTLPSVEGGWYINSNIMRDPPKSIHTRRIDKVGDTNAINLTIEEAPDRQCEAINYYARGVNPMVSVDYGQGQKGAGTGNGCSGGAQAFLPHRIMREGAFRPPVREGVTSLLPLSRMPRVWTEVTATPYMPIFTKRLQDCGTGEQTREVRNDILRMSCFAQKAIQTYPDLFEPSTKLQIRDSPIVCENVIATRSCPNSDVDVVQRNTQLPITLPPTRPSTSVMTNKRIQKETPTVCNNIQLGPTRPNAVATTSLSATSFGTNTLQTPIFTRLPERRQLGGFEGYKQIPIVEKINPTYNLKSPGLKTVQRV